MKKHRAALAVAVATIGLATWGCGAGSGGDNAACGKALDSYHAALVASDADGTGSNLTSAQEKAHQADVVNHCSEAQFVALVKGDGYDYTTGPDAVALGDPQQVYQAFKSNAG